MPDVFSNLPVSMQCSTDHIIVGLLATTMLIEGPKINPVSGPTEV